MTDRSRTPAPSRRGLLKITGALSMGLLAGAARPALAGRERPSPQLDIAGGETYSSDYERCSMRPRSLREEWGDMGFLWRDENGRAAMEHAIAEGVRPAQVFALINGSSSGWTVCVQDHPTKGELTNFTRDGRGR